MGWIDGPTFEPVYPEVTSRAPDDGGLDRVPFGYGRSVQSVGRSTRRYSTAPRDERH
jgi:hypothetical protein